MKRSVAEGTKEIVTGVEPGSFAPDEERPPPKALDDLEATTAESKELAKELKKRGFAFVGPTTIYATMQAIGVVNDHLAGCAFR